MREVIMNEFFQTLFYIWFIWWVLSLLFGPREVVVYFPEKKKDHWMYTEPEDED